MTGHRENPGQRAADCLDSSWSEENQILEDCKDDIDVTSTLILIMHSNYTDSVFPFFYVPLVSSLAFCVAKSASQCRAELLPSPDKRDSLEEDWGRLQGEDVPLAELLVLPTVSPPPLSDDAAVCVVSVLIADVSPSDF